jgi:hypothetical protein
LHRVEGAPQVGSGAAPKIGAQQLSDASGASIPALEAAPARSNKAVPKPAYSKSISQSRAPSSRKFAGKKVMMAKDDGQRRLCIASSLSFSSIQPGSPSLNGLPPVAMVRA